MSKMLMIAATVAALLFCGALMQPTPVEAGDGGIQLLQSPSTQLSPAHPTYRIYQSFYVTQRHSDERPVYTVRCIRTPTSQLSTYTCLCADGSTCVCQCDESRCICPGCDCGVRMHAQQKTLNAERRPSI